MDKPNAWYLFLQRVFNVNPYKIVNFIFKIQKYVRAVFNRSHLRAPWDFFSHPTRRWKEEIEHSTYVFKLSKKSHKQKMASDKRAEKKSVVDCEVCLKTIGFRA